MYPRIEPLADAPGTCELMLTRAIIQYRPRQELETGVGPIDDIGLALVFEGEYAASAEAIDLGSGRVRHLDLGAELVVIDWAYETTLDYVRMLLHASGSGPERGLSRALVQYCQGLALGVLRRAGFSAVTRPTLLRMGFRDLVRDLDANERTAVRLARGSGEAASLRFDVDQNALLLERRRTGVDPELERLLLAAFPGADARRLRNGPGALYQLRFPLPLSLAEARDLLDQIRHGVLHLYGRYEPERLQVIHHALDVFGPRNTLAQLEPRDRHPEPVSLRSVYVERRREPGAA